MKVVLDTGVLGFLTHPTADKARPCVEWMRGLLDTGATFIIPEVCDYELRREYIRNASGNALKKLDQLIEYIEFQEVGTDTWRRAAEIWAECRNKGKQTAPDEALDGDVILIALTEQVSVGEQTVIATTNVKHLKDYADAREWTNVTI